MPIAAARIATCEVGPPAARQMPASRVASSETSCEGLRSSAIRIARSGRLRTTIGASPFSASSTCDSRSSRSSTRSAHARIAERAQRIGAVANRAAPREAGALAARDRAARRRDQLPIVEKFQVRRDHFARRRPAPTAASCSSRARTSARARSNSALSCAMPLPGFGDLHSRRLAAGRATDGEAAARDHAAQAARRCPCRRCRVDGGGSASAAACGRALPRFSSSDRINRFSSRDRLRRAVARRDQRQLVAALRAERHQRHCALRIRAAAVRGDRDLRRRRSWRSSRSARPAARGCRARDRRSLAR